MMVNNLLTTTPPPSAAPLRQRRGLCAINKHQPPRPPTLRYGATPLHLGGESIGKRKWILRIQQFVLL
ncbi:MAG: hypothetical protein LBB23_01480 [Rickettsiales bacterium]|nr:hypothetical protein [Rickettsiales bacterium]